MRFSTGIPNEIAQELAATVHIIIEVDSCTRHVEPGTKGKPEKEFKRRKQGEAEVKKKKEKKERKKLCPHIILSVSVAFPVVA